LRAIVPTSKDISPFQLTPRTFTQERARKTFESLLEAAWEVFAERGFDATQTPEIATRAGVSVGTFYRYFSDKKEAYVELVRRDLGRAYREVMGGLTPERFADTGRRATIQQTIELLLANVHRHPGMQRVFLEMSLRDDEVAELKRAFDSEARRGIAALIRAICPPEEVPDPEATAYVIHTAVVECALAIAGARGGWPLPEERAIAALSELVYRALFGIER
jgi:AcrR family transcriptional regulator